MRKMRGRRLSAAALTLMLLCGTLAAGAAPAVKPGAATPPKPAAKPAERSLVSQSPGYVPSVDPESTSLVIGRRLNAPLVSMRFKGGAKSLDDLGRIVCRSLEHGRRDSLMVLCVTDTEFRVILWREFPQSRPATGLEWVDAWRILFARLSAGCSQAMRDYGGHHYDFIRFQADSVMQYKNFKLYSRIQIVAKDDQGQVLSMRWLRGVAERKGAFKIYSTND